MSAEMDSSLLLRAAECFLRAGWQDDACRCFDHAGDHARAARLHMEARRWHEAALGFSAAGLWRQAAECHVQADAPVEAAECLLRAGDPLSAGWLLADGAHRFSQARAVASEVEASSPAARLARDLVLARCDAGTGLADAAARRIQAVLACLADLGPGSHLQRLVDWSVTVADTLRRPDLAARMHAAAVRAGMPGAVERWDFWALATLGEAPSLPEEFAPEAPVPPMGSGEEDSRE